MWQNKSCKTRLCKEIQAQNYSLFKFKLPIDKILCQCNIYLLVNHLMCSYVNVNVLLAIAIGTGSCNLIRKLESSQSHV